MTGLGVPHILQSRATESNVAGFTLEKMLHDYDTGSCDAKGWSYVEYIEIIMMSTFEKLEWLLTAPVVDPMGLPPIPMPIPLKRKNHSF